MPEASWSGLPDLLVDGIARIAEASTVANASSPSDYDAAFAKLVEQGARALVVSSDLNNTVQREGAQIVALAARHALPAIYLWHGYTEAGGLMSYGLSNLDEGNRVAGTYAGRILKGEKPADLPVQQSTKVELVINLNTAKALGLTIPPSLLRRADQVIQ